jgi:mRNA interferase ChpB
MRRGEIWFVDLDPAVGNEQKGFRPVLVVSSDQFGRITGNAIICPITNGGISARSAGFVVSLLSTGLKTSGVVLTNQPRTIDLKARSAKRIELAPDVIVDDVLARLAAILE